MVPRSSVTFGILPAESWGSHAARGDRKLRSLPLHRLCVALSGRVLPRRCGAPVYRSRGVYRLQRVHRRCPVHAIYDVIDMPDDKVIWIKINAERSAQTPVIRAQQEPLATAPCATRRARLLMSTKGGDIHIAIVGSGPSGFYAAEALLRSERPITIDLYERLPAPYGLVRSGVAPDHQKLKQSIQVFERIARHPNLNYLGNVDVGVDVSVRDLREAYHAVIFACGAQMDRRMGIPGEDLTGSHTATEFVGWYNGHPDFRDRVFDLQQERVAIVGQGNVAADVCRILITARGRASDKRHCRTRPGCSC